MAIKLMDVGYDIFDKIVALKVRDDQKHLVDDNSYALSQAQSEQDLRPLAIYNDDELVGFCMYGTDEEDGYITIYNMMIDAVHQGKGYSTQALKSLLELIRTERNPAAVYAEISQDNKGAKAIFTKAGFKPSGERAGDKSKEEWVYLVPSPGKTA